MSDEEWQVTEPPLPAPAWKAGKGGRPAGHCRRDIAGAIRYLAKGCGRSSTRACSKLKRLASRGILVETEPGLFTQPRP